VAAAHRLPLTRPAAVAEGARAGSSPHKELDHTTKKGIDMRATLIYGPGDVRVEDVPDPAIRQPTDAVVRVLRSCICGSDLWPYGSRPASDHGDRIGHEFLGVVEETGSQVSSGLKRGDLVVAPFVWSDNTCDFCREGLQTSCRHGGNWGRDGVDGGQGEAVRVPQADGTLVKLAVGEDSALLPSLLTLSDVFSTGHHCAVTAGVGPRTTVTVIGDGAVGLSAVLAARRLGAERIILMGRHKDRTDLGLDFGATDVVAERGEEGTEKVRELTGGDGTHTVLECVGLKPAIETALGVVRAGGTVSRVGAPQYADVPMDFAVFLRNITLTGGVAPARAYIEELLPDVLEGRVEPGRVFDRTVGLDEVPDGYRAMADREALKVLIRP
jgi:threonine dehydrogenase-like Zn-dependent dehydrogenase